MIREAARVGDNVGRRRPRIEELKHFFPFSQMTPEVLDSVGEQAYVVTLRPGLVLFTRGKSDRWAYYLLAGKIRLLDENNQSRVLEAGTVQATQALAPGTPRDVTAMTMNNAVVMRVNARALEGPDPHVGGACYTVDELHAEDSDARNRIQFQLYMDYIEDRLEIPGLPEISLRIRHAIENPDTGVDEITRMLQEEPSLAAHLVKVANSALYGSAAPINNLRDAVVRLGLAATRDMVIQFVISHLFKPDHDELKRRMLALWRQSSLVAAVSYILSRELNRFNPEQALLAGLTQGIGAAALITRADAYPELVSDPALLEAVITELAGEVGGMVLRKWRFPEIFAIVAQESGNWARVGGDDADLCDLVLIARLYADKAGTGGLSGTDLDGIPAARKLGYFQGAESNQVKVLAEAKERIVEIRNLLL